jgi:Uma2 family endonuclease
MAATIIEPRTDEFVIERPTPPGKMTFEEYLAWADEDTFAEWVDGEVVWMSPVSNKHEEIAQFLSATMSVFVKRRKLGVVRTEPFGLKTGRRGRACRLPDLQFLATEHLDRLRNSYIDGPADLVIEIVSLESRDRDRVTKFSEYEEGGVREYWLIDPTREQAEFYQRGEDGLFHAVSIGDDGRYVSRELPGVWVRPEWFWEDPLPDEIEVVQEWEKGL